MKVSDAIAEILRREGVEIVIGYPVNHILERGAAAGIRPIIVRQERTGLHMADAMSRVTSGRQLGVFVMQHGPGTENAYGGVAQAWSESVPILVMPGGYARRLAWVERNYNASVEMRGITKSAEPVTSGKELSAIMRRAFTRLKSGRGGPVLVEVPNDVWNEEADPSDYVVSRPLRSGPDPDAIREAAKMLLAAKRPVLYAGQGVHWAEAWSELKQLAELLAIPVTTSLQARARFPRRTRSRSAPAGWRSRRRCIISSRRPISSSASAAASRRRISACRCRPARPSSTRRSIRPT
jgi:thiamine pyrophosphate-dependent acetolactate synthase large subunit-like protein